MKIIRTYILKDFLTAFFFSILTFTAVMALGNLIKITDVVIHKGVNIFDALKMFFLFVPFSLRFSIPLACLLGILLCMGRLITDNEFIAINVAGISFFKVLNIFLIVGIIFSLGLFILNDKVIPYLQYQYRSIAKGVYAKNIHTIIEPGVFLDYFQNYVLYISDRDEHNLKNVFIYETAEAEGKSKVTFARKGRFVIEKNVVKMELENGFRDEIKEQNQKEFYRLNFKKFFMEIPIEKKETTTVRQKPSDMSIKELIQKKRELASKGINAVELTMEIYQRINFSFSVITFILLGFGVSLAVKHREKSINFGIAFITTGLYYLISILGQGLVQQRIILPFVGMFLANFIIGLIGGLLIFRYASRR